MSLITYLFYFKIIFILFHHNMLFVLTCSGVIVILKWISEYFKNFSFFTCFKDNFIYLFIYYYI